MGVGYIKVSTQTADGSLPVGGAQVVVKQPRGKLLYTVNTDENGQSRPLALTAPDRSVSLDPYAQQPAGSLSDLEISANGYSTVHLNGVQIVDGETSLVTVEMYPLLDEPDPVRDLSITIPPNAQMLPPARRDQPGPASDKLAQRRAYQRRLLASTGKNYMIPTMQNQGARAAMNRRGVHRSSPQMTAVPAVAYGVLDVSPSDILVPEYITVHLGAPTNAAARNVRVKFIDYVKNVASSEIYPTWPQNSLLSNIAAIVSFALNRVYTEWYRSRGFQFDITNSTAYDQYYRDGAEVYSSISTLVDDYFNTFVRRIGFRNPFFTQFCNGTTATCDGLSQWGTVTLANQGQTPLQILRYYYPNDVELATSNNIAPVVESFPGTALRVGSQGEDVRRMQNFLNRIRVNYPLIPPINNPNGVFDEETRNAVTVFQRTFDLTPDGIIGRATWNKISFLFTGVARLAELDGEGERVGLGLAPPSSVLSQGARGHDVLELQFILNAIAPYYSTIPHVIKDSVFDPNVTNAVIEFQKAFDLTSDGIVGPATWQKLYAVYRGIEDNVKLPPVVEPDAPAIPQYPGNPLRVGSSGAQVRLMQTYLNTIRIVYPNIPYLVVDGIFGENTKRAVTAFQQEFVLDTDGIIGPVTWDYITKQFQLVTGMSSTSLEYPGVPLQLGSTGSSVRTMQGFLRELHSAHPSIPQLSADGVFGPETQRAVEAFQRLFNLTVDGIIGPVTWYAILQQRNAVV